VIQPFIFIGVGVLVFLGADWVSRLYSCWADAWERDGVIRRGGLSRKIWREDEPDKFASRIDEYRFAGAASRWFLKMIGAIFAIGGIVALIGLLVK